MAVFSNIHRADPFSGSKYVLWTIPWRAGRTPVTMEVCEGYVSDGNCPITASAQLPRARKASSAGIFAVRNGPGR
jgi:hypothetical protein